METTTTTRRRESMTPEEKLARHKTVLRRFRAVVHLVMANQYWLSEIEDEHISDNVAKNIRMLTREKKILSTLTTKEKSILMKPIEERTDEEKRKVSKVITGLRCFRKYPTDVKNQLAGITFFVYYPPDRVIVKQDHPPKAMYFILSGEARATTSHFDKYLEEWIVEETGILKPGSTFGEIALLHDEGRVNTITTITNCEMLMIKKDEFMAVVKDTVLKAWNEIQSALDTFPFFDSWETVTKREVAILTLIKHFPPDETILGDDMGLEDYVYFITKGTCAVVENLNVTVFTINDLQTFTLNPTGEYDDAASINLTNIFRKYKRYFVASDEELSIAPSQKARRRASRKSARSTVSAKSQKSDKDDTKSKKSVRSQKSDNDDTKSMKSARSVKTSKPLKVRKSEKSVTSTEERAEDRPKDTISDIISETETETDVQEYEVEPQESIKHFGRPHYETECHFLKVGDLFEGGCFNIGERLTRRRIIAVTPVSCLLIPRYWVMRNNKGNMWNRVQKYINDTIPSTPEIFKKFVEMKKFKEYSKSLIRDILRERNILTNNCICNVPYSIRMREGTDTEYNLW